MHAITAPPDVSPADRLGVTVFFAIAAHLIVILGVTFVPDERPRIPVNKLDVVLVQQATERAPEDADYLAQASHEGGGESDEPARPTTPLPAPFAAAEPDLAAAAVPAAPPAPPAPEPEPVREPPPPPPAVEAAPPPKPVLAQTEAPARTRVPEPEPAPEPEARAEPEPRRAPEPAPERKRFASSTPERKTEAEAPAPPEPAPPSRPEQPRSIDAKTLVNRTLAMASLRAEIDAKLKAYAERPRRKWISARTREHKYAAYMEAWRRKVERIGNLNYPDEARRRRLSGRLVLDVALNGDGTINEIILRNSSGKRVLDDAAARIVKLAAPFAKFPPDIAEEVDILHIERTWVFLSSNRFASN